MSCCGGCPERPREVHAPCVDCGPYGWTCCLKAVGLGETIYFRAVLDEVPGVIPEQVLPDLRQLDIEVAERWVDGDDCPEILGAAQYMGRKSNLCGTLVACGPCRVHGKTATGAGRGAHTIRWQVSDDCTSVAFTITFYGAADNAITRYTGTASTAWLITGGAVTVGPFVVTTCPVGEPLRKLVNICCWQATITTPAGSFTSEWGPGAAISNPAVAERLCTKDPRLQYVPTEQCGGLSPLSSGFFGGIPAIAGGSIGHWFNSSLGVNCPVGQAYWGYRVSDDYSTVRITFGLSASPATGGGIWVWSYDGTVSGSTASAMVIEIPYTETWYVTPIVLTPNGGMGDIGAATITLAVCGVVDPPDPGDECYDSLCVRWTTEERDSVAEELDGDGHASRTWYGAGATPWAISVSLARVSGPDASGVTTWTITITVTGGATGMTSYGPFARTITSTCVGGVPVFDYWEGFELEGVYYFEIDLGCGDHSGDNRPCLAQPIYVTNGPITTEFGWSDPNERETTEAHVVSGHTIVTTYHLSYVSGPTLPLNTVWWELHVTVYDQTAATMLCDETYDLSGYCDENDVFQMSAEISVCGLSLLVHAGS